MSKDFKDTLLMPKTNFEMRANLNEKEIIIQNFWKEANIYEKLILNNKGNKSFILHDGPPYANGNLHLGHGLNKILKDIIVRYYNANNFYCPFIPGWDTHGLPIEQAVSKNGIDRKQISSSVFRKQCEIYATNQIETQKTQFKRLGLLADFQKYYVTFDNKYEAEQIKLFAKMVEKNTVYRNLYPVYWSPSSETALAEAEIEYIDKKSPSIYVSFSLTNLENDNKLYNAELVIWTTTPWTIPANQMLAINENFTYQLLLINDKKIIIAQDLATNFLKQNKVNEFKVLNTNIMGNELVNLFAIHPLYNLKVPVVHSDHVTSVSGTGIVHVAPGFGVDDFNLGKKHGIKPLVPINDQGIFTSEINDKLLENIFYDDANKLIVQRLINLDKLVGFQWIKHSYPHDWRTKKPVIFRATKQWFVAIDKLKSVLLKNIDNINFVPGWGKKRMSLMTENRHDWCISRQRLWGVPIPIFYSEKKTPILDTFVINHIANLFAQYGSNIWFKKSAIDLLPDGYIHADSPNGIFYKENDIMDVWFDSGISHLFVTSKYQLSKPFDLYLEGNDQFRGWFNSSLITGVIANDHAPYKSVLAHGFVNDEKGNKMSKSLGNITSVIDVCTKYGADIMRLWVASVDFQDDVKIGVDILKQISENYRKIRNLIRFLLGNLNDFDFKVVVNNSFINNFKNLQEVDMYILIKLNNLISISHESYKSYRFNSLYHQILNFITNDLSAFYCDYSKDILYVDSKNNPRRKQIQLTFYYLVINLIKILSPILPHTCEEAFQSLNNSNFNNKNSSIIFEGFPRVEKLLNSEKLIEKWDLFMKMRSEVKSALSQAQTKNIIKDPLEAQVFINLRSDAEQLLTIKETELAKLLIVSSVKYVTDDDCNFISNSRIAKIIVQLMPGKKCPRCWLICNDLINNICERCFNVLKDRDEVENENN